jgi:predicted ABC-type transport system involved in lysophospholipase L1 biosynthesis ATPase subunit
MNNTQEQQILEASLGLKVTEPQAQYIIRRAGLRSVRLQEQLLSGKSLTEVGRDEKISKDRVKQFVSSLIVAINQSAVIVETPTTTSALENLMLPVQVENALKRNGCVTIDDVVSRVFLNKKPLHGLSTVRVAEMLATRL